ncbi:MAG: tetratricopeptide repeat protein [Proteobacteria bacterium]|nr:tetratricopeptide repeat protein [Pseudomonadota bacterium]
MRTHTLCNLMTALTLCGFSLLANAGYEEDVKAQLAQGNFQGALELIDQGLEQNGENRKLLLAKGFSLIKLNRLDEAARYYEQLRVIMKNDPEPANNLAMVYRLQKNYAQAITIFSETIRDFPDYIKAYDNLGNTYIEIAQNQYQRGFAATGNVTLQQKALLSLDFGQIANQAVTESTQRLQRAAPPPPPVVTPAPPVAPPPPPAVTPPPVKKPDPRVQYQQEIVGTLTSWVDDWMSLDENRYLSHYSHRFSPEENYTLNEWIGHKQSVFRKAGEIKVYLTDIKISFDPDNIKTATVTFRQQYASKIFTENSVKELVLEKTPEGWYIVKETSVDS